MQYMKDDWTHKKPFTMFLVATLSGRFKVSMRTDKTKKREKNLCFA